MIKTNNMKIEELKKQLDSIQEQIKQLENPKFEGGKWYYSKGPHDGYAIVNAQIKCDNGECEYYGYGIGYDPGKGWVNRGLYIYDNARPATHSEVESALIAEAEKRGFKEGVRIDRIIASGSTKGDKANEDCYGTLNYCMVSDQLDFTNYTIYERGIWAEIIKEDKIEIGGYEVKPVTDSTIGYAFKIGCKEISKSELIHIQDFMRRNKFTKVSFDGIETNLETINKIINKL